MFKDILFSLLGVFSSYLFMDKFLFGGRLARLFLDGWRKISSVRDEADRKKSAEAGSEELIVRKAYAECLEMPANDIAPKTEPNGSQEATFTAERESEQSNVLMEYVSEKYRKNVSAEAEAQYWDQEDFARFAEPDIDLDQEPKQSYEEYRRMRYAANEEDDALPVSDEERYDIEHFDAQKYLP